MFLSPYDLYKRGVHEAREVDYERFVELRDALIPLRRYGDRSSFDAFVRNWLPFEPRVEPLSFGGRMIVHVLWSACAVPGTGYLGMGLWHRMWGEQAFWSIDGVPLVDSSELIVCPEWDAASPFLPYVACKPERLLEEHVWEAEVDDCVEEHVRQWLRETKQDDDRGMDVNRLTRSIMEEYERGFENAKLEYRAALIRAADRGSAVVVWEEENLSI